MKRVVTVGVTYTGNKIEGVEAEDPGSAGLMAIQSGRPTLVEYLGWSMMASSLRKPSL
jgi:hypothetical protein